MKAYVAYQDGTTQGMKLVDKSLTTMKKRLKEHPGTSWTVAFYKLLPGAANLCAAIEDISQFEAESVQGYSVSPKGRIQMTDPP